MPLYLQTADYVHAQIASGHLLVGGGLSSERDLAEQMGIAYQTVRGAMREPRERGLVASVIGKVTYISTKPWGAAQIANLLFHRVIVVRPSTAPDSINFSETVRV